MRKFTDCIVCCGGYPTEDGYIRVLDKPRKQGGKLKMLHRLEWEKVNGTIPDGHEVDHRCKNRKCQNVNHLQILTKSQHKSKDNAQRYLERQVKVLRFAESNQGLTLKGLSEQLGLSVSYLANVFRQYPGARGFVSFQR